MSLVGCGGPRPTEIARLTRLLDWRAGQTVADVGAGTGDYAVEIAGIVGGMGTVYATEVSDSKLGKLRRLARKRTNLRVVRAGEGETGLSPDCCDSILLRGVYHHLTNPAATDASLFRALKSGGHIAVIDFPPKRLLSWLFPVRGVPRDRGGHGIQAQLVIRELQGAGFHLEHELVDWTGGQYCITARKN